MNTIQPKQSPCLWNNENQNIISLIPVELAWEIFSQLTLDSLAKSCCVSKIWKRLAGEPIVWKTVIYRELAFSNHRWAEVFGPEVVKDEDNTEEFKSLPLNIAEEYRKFQSAFPQENSKDALILVRLPKTLNGGLTLRNIKKLAKQFFKEAGGGFSPIIRSRIVTEMGDKSIDQSRWVLMTKKILLGSSRKSCEDQQKIVAELAKKTLSRYEFPEILEAALCILAQYIISDTGSTISNNPMLETRCKDYAPGKHVIVGGLAPRALYINNLYTAIVSLGGQKKIKFDKTRGVAALLKLHEN